MSAVKPVSLKPFITAGRMEGADIKKIKDLEDENRLLKQMFADLSLENRALKDVIEKNVKSSDEI
jgi:putative transposase